MPSDLNFVCTSSCSSWTGSRCPLELDGPCCGTESSAMNMYGHGMSIHDHAKLASLFCPLLHEQADV